MNGFTACYSLLAGVSSSSSRQEPVDPQAVHAREVRMTPVALHVQLHEPEHPLLMVLGDSRSGGWAAPVALWFSHKQYVTCEWGLLPAVWRSAQSPRPGRRERFRVWSLHCLKSSYPESETETEVRPFIEQVRVRTEQPNSRRWRTPWGRWWWSRWARRSWKCDRASRGWVWPGGTERWPVVRVGQQRPSSPLEPEGSEPGGRGWKEGWQIFRAHKRKKIIFGPFNEACFHGKPAECNQCNVM